jgi:Myb-like DNA-binding domain
MMQALPQGVDANKRQRVYETDSGTPAAPVTNFSVIRSTLESNLKLQQSILKEVEQLSQAKAMNRKRYFEILIREELEHDSPEETSATACSVPEDLGSKNLYRKWKRRLFAVSAKDSPSPNMDTVRRQQMRANTFFHYETGDSKPGNNSFAKEEQSLLLKILEDFRTAGRGNDDLLDWSSIAEAMSKSGTRQFTAWQCFAAYRSSSSESDAAGKTVWTADEEELLLRYLTAAGPCAVVDGELLVDVATRLMPHRSGDRNQLLRRVNSTLLNPALIQAPWSDAEERRLALCMKVYSNPKTSEPTSSVVKKALAAASAHFPCRSSKSIEKKWYRQLNPSISVLPFSPAEDAKLMHVMRNVPSQGHSKARSDVCWTEIARQHFPDRDAARLQSRWNDYVKPRLLSEIEDQP